MKRKAKRCMGRRKSKRHEAKDKTGGSTTQPGAGSPADLQSAQLTEETETPSPQPKDEETLTKDAEAETETQTPLSPNKTPAGNLELNQKFPVVLLKPVFTPAQGYRCQVCTENFPTVSQFLKHQQLHEGKTQDGEICEQPFTSQADCNEQQQAQEPSFPCNICDRSFTSSHHLKRHKLLHVKDGRKCHMCGVLFCQRHNHVLYLPQTETLVEFEEESSIMESETSLPESPESNQIPVPTEKTQSTLTITLPPTSPQISPASPEYSRPLSKTRNPLPPPSHTYVLTEIPLPVYKKHSWSPYQTTRYSVGPRTPTELRHLLPDHFSAVHQPHSPPGKELPPSLQMFSTKALTSPFFEVTRNYQLILSNENRVKKIEDKNWKVPLVSGEGQSIRPEQREENISYLDVVF